MTIERHLEEIGLALPPRPEPRGSDLPAALHSGILSLSGPGPMMEDGTLATSKAGDTVTVEIVANLAVRA